MERLRGNLRLAARLVDDRLEVALRFGWRQPAQTIVAAEFEHQDVHGPLEQPVDAAQSARRGVAAQARIDGLVWQARVLEPLVDQRGECLLAGVVESYPAVRLSPKNRIVRRGAF